ncbi:MAG: acyl-CoA dehydrogenase domain-containing protein, partial [Gammaproteobacteria bacterium]
RVVELVINPSASRDRLCAPVYRTLEPGSHLGLLQEAMELSIAITPLEKKLRRAVKEGIIKPLLLAEQITAAVTAGVLTEDEAHRMREADLKIMEIITVDDFDSSELARQQAPPEPKAPKRVARKKKAAARRPTPVEEQEVAAGGG